MFIPWLTPTPPLIWSMQVLTQSQWKHTFSSLVLLYFLKHSIFYAFIVLSYTHAHTHIYIVCTSVMCDSWQLLPSYPALSWKRDFNLKETFIWLDKGIFSHLFPEYDYCLLFLKCLCAWYESTHNAEFGKGLLLLLLMLPDVPVNLESTGRTWKTVKSFILWL